jgi:hypothetical protein
VQYRGEADAGAEMLGIRRDGEHRLCRGFTEAQAKSRIEKAGYSNISGLIKTKTESGRARPPKEEHLSS